MTAQPDDEGRCTRERPCEPCQRGDEARCVDLVDRAGSLEAAARARGTTAPPPLRRPDPASGAYRRAAVAAFTPSPPRPPRT